MAKTISNLNKSQKEIINDEMYKRNVVSSSELIEDVDFDLNENIIDRIEALEQEVVGSEELLTSDKTIVGAINELFQNVDSGKQLIAGAIGDSSITKNSTFQAMSDAIAGRVKPAGTAVASNVLTGKTFINSTGETITGTMSQLTSNIANVTTNAPKHYQTDKVTIKDLSGLGGICTYFQVPTNTNTGNIQWIMSYTPDLIAANIISGKSILGVNGTASASAYPIWYNPENTWMHISTAKLVYCPSDSKMSVVLGDDIYIFTTSRYCKYSTKTNVCSESIAYTNVPSTSELSRGDFTVVNCNGLFYFIGGLKSYSSDRQNANNYLMTFNPSNNTWTTKANMITALNQALACVYDNKIYVFGGCTYKEYYSGNYLYGRSNKSSKYDPSTNTWTSITDVPKYKTLPPIVVNNCAYLPGTGGTTTRYKYDFSTGTYTEFTSGLSLSTSVAYKNRIYSFGASSSTRRTTMYDTTTGTETDKAICNVNKSGGSAHAMGDLIYYLGGSTKNSNGYYINAYYYGDIYIPEK